MRYLLPAFLILAIVLGFVLTHPRRSAPPAPQSMSHAAGTPVTRVPAADFTGDANINICIPLTRAITLDSEGVMRTYAKQWKRLMACVEKPAFADAKTKTRAYALSDGDCSLLLLVSGDTLPRELLNIAAASGGMLDARQRKALNRSQGYLLISNVIGSPVAVERVKFAAQVILSLLRQREALGYVNVSAQRYWAKDRLAPYQQATRLTPLMLYTLMSGEQISANGQTLDVLGMAQFDLPDMEITLAKERQLSYYQAVLSTVATRCIEHNQALKTGVVIQPAGDGIAYKVLRAQQAPENQFGPLGAIILARQGK